MSRTLKIVLLAFAAVLAVVVAVVGFVAATFDPNAYKPQIIQAVKDKTQRTLKLEGDIRLAFWPSIGSRIGRASLSERGSEREFASVQEAQVAVKLMPLLSKQVIVDGVELRGLRASLVRSRDGKTNIDDLAGGGAPVPREQPAGPVPVVDIARVVIQDADLSYREEAAGTQITLSGLDLKTGRLASGVPDGVVVTLTLGVQHTGGVESHRVDLLLRAAEVVLDWARLDGTRAGNGDGVQDAGEAIDLYYRLANRGGGTAQRVSLTLATSVPALEILVDSVVVPDILPGTTVESVAALVVREPDLLIPRGVELRARHLQNAAGTLVGLDLRRPAPPVGLRFGSADAVDVIWPEVTRPHAFPDVIESYRLAAADVGARLLPAGRAWQIAWSIEPGLALYGPDGFHPSRDGSLLAAIVIYEGLTGRSASAQRWSPRPRDRRFKVLPRATPQTLLDAAARARRELGGG